MPFRWMAFLRLLGPLTFFITAAMMICRPAARGLVAIPLVVLGAAGALLGLVFLFTGVRFRCPFCRRWGPGTIEVKGRPRMECAACGTIRCEGFLGFRIVKEP